MEMDMTTLTLTERAAFTQQVAEKIRKTGFRFDSSWRQADLDADDPQEAAKAAFYEKCCTFAANVIADDPGAIVHFANI